MTTKHGVAFGPRLIGAPTGRLRAAVLVEPAKAIERGNPLAGEPGAIYERAREQHAVLCSTLRYFGVQTTVLPAQGHDPYEAAAADAAVALEDGAVLMRTSVMTRRSETERIEKAFANIDVPLAGRITAPGFLDGSDVLLVGKTAFIGVGSRGNDLGRAGFAAVARAHGYRPVEVRLAPGVSCLRAVVGALAEDTVVVGDAKADVGAFEGFRTIVLQAGDENGAGVLCLGERHVVADLRYMSVPETLGRVGFTVEALDLYEFAKLGIGPSMLALDLKRD